MPVFKLAFDVVVDTLEHLQHNHDDKARMFKAAILRFDLIIGLIVCQHILHDVVPLSGFLQDSSCDMLSAIDECRVVISKLERKREDDAVWESLFKEATEIADKHDVEPSFPRRAGRQQHRANVPADNPSDYWRRALYYVFLDHLLGELRQRLIVSEPRFLANFLLPVKVTRHQVEEDKLAEIFNAYKTDIPGDFDFFKTEVDRWILRWSLAKQKPSTLCDTLSMTAKELYPCMWNVLLTMPVATATAERSFSVLRRVKT